jgi:hypothetical protein
MAGVVPLPSGMPADATDVVATAGVAGGWRNSGAGGRPGRTGVSARSGRSRGPADGPASMAAGVWPMTVAGCASGTAKDWTGAADRFAAAAGTGGTTAVGSTGFSGTKDSPAPGAGGRSALSCPASPRTSTAVAGSAAAPGNRGLVRGDDPEPNPSKTVAKVSRSIPGPFGIKDAPVSVCIWTGTPAIGVGTTLGIIIRAPTSAVGAGIAWQRLPVVYRLRSILPPNRPE